MDNPALLDLLKSEFDFLIEKSHRSGLSFWQILKVILSRIETLVMQADAEYWFKGGK